MDQETKDYLDKKFEEQAESGLIARQAFQKRKHRLRVLFGIYALIMFFVLLALIVYEMVSKLCFLDKIRIYDQTIKEGLSVRPD